MSFSTKKTGRLKDMFNKKINISYNIIERISTPFPIMKRIDEMKYCIDNIYTKFYNQLSDKLMHKKLEEYRRLKKMEKMNRIKFLQDLAYYFEEKIRDIKIKRSKSIGIILDTGLLYSKIIKYYKNENGYKKYFPYLAAIKKEEKIRLNCITEYNMINVIKKIRRKRTIKKSINLTRIQRINVKRLSSIVNAKDSSKIKQHLSKSLIFKNLNNKNSKDFSSENNYNPSSSPMRYESNKYKKYNFFIPKKNSIINSSRYDSKNNFTPNKNLDNGLIRKKIKSIFEIKQRAFKILPKLSNSFNTTLSKSFYIKNDLKSFQKDEIIRSESSKKRNQKIIKQFFSVYKDNTIKNSLKIKKNKNKKKSISFKSIKSIIENLKYTLNKKEKSPLSYIEDYNKLRNRRRKNKEFEESIGLIFDSLSKNKINRANVYLGMSFKDILKVNT